VAVDSKPVTFEDLIIEMMCEWDAEFKNEDGWKDFVDEWWTKFEQHES
jgi:hypothetical protein